MIRVNTNETFPISVGILNELTGEYVSGETVEYTIRTVAGALTVSGTLIESPNESGIYRTSTTISSPGEYILYTTCSGYLPESEDIIVNAENIYDLVKQNRHYNISVEDVTRTDEPPTASQTARNVPLNKTDYIVTKIRSDGSSDWSGATTSGVVYAHYSDITDEVPYKMGSEF